MGGCCYFIISIIKFYISVVLLFYGGGGCNSDQSRTVVLFFVDITAAASGCSVLSVESSLNNLPEKKNSSVQVVPVTGCHCFRRMVEILDIAMPSHQSQSSSTRASKHSLQRLLGPCLFIVYLYYLCLVGGRKAIEREMPKLLLLPCLVVVTLNGYGSCARLEQHEMLMLSAKANLISPSCIALNLHNLNYL